MFREKPLNTINDNTTTKYAYKIPLSHPQRRIYYTERLFPGTSANILAFTVKYTEILDVHMFGEAVNVVLKRNQGLRLRLTEDKERGEIMQYESEHTDYIADRMDFSHDADGTDLEQWLAETTRTPFDFLDSRLFYIAYIRFSDNESGYYLKLHHIISDGWTIFLLGDEIDRVYRELESGGVPSKIPNPPYSAFVDDEKNYLSSKEAAEDRKFWHNLLSPIPDAIKLTENQKKASCLRGQSFVTTLDDSLRSLLLDYCKTNNISIYKVMFSALSVCLAQYTGLEDFVIGGANHNRCTAEQKKMIGMFVSTLPQRVKVDADMSFSSFVAEQGRQINYMIKNRQRYPFDLLAGELRKQLGEDTEFLLNVNLVGHPDVDENRFTMRHIFQGDEINPLTIHINSSNQNIHGKLELEYFWLDELFDRDDLTCFSNNLEVVLTNALLDPGQMLRDIGRLSEGDREKILTEFNGPAVERIYSSEKTLTELFLDCVESRRDTVALVETGNRGETSYFTYGELDKSSDIIAEVLVAQGAGPGKIVGILGERTNDLISGILGILKTGSAYLPLSTRHPLSRISYLLKDSGVTRLLATGEHHALSSQLVKEHNTIGELEIIEVQDVFSSKAESKAKPDKIATLTPPTKYDVAYVIYTSGSTGRPKGVPIRHRNVTPLFHWGHRTLGLNPEDRIIQNVTHVFDWSVWEIFITLTSGSSLLIVPERRSLDPVLHKQSINRFGVTALHITPAQCNYMLEEKQILPSLRFLFMGAEKMPPDMGEKCFSRILNRYGGRLFNMYGPTEASIIATVLEIKPEMSPDYIGRPSMPIGSPIANLGMLILDRYMNLCPIGAPGELFIHGDGVADGYLNRIELTAGVFVNTDLPVGGGTTNPKERCDETSPPEFFKISELKQEIRTLHHKSAQIYPNVISKKDGHESKNSNNSHLNKRFRESRTPFSKGVLAAGGNLYKTGDLARYLADGNIEFLGRVDHQVKIRGHRIELAEIENEILSIDGVKSVAVAVHGETTPVLCGYYVLEKPGCVTVLELRSNLEKSLPEYMVPTYLMELKSLPLSTSGKVERSRLPEPSSAGETVAGYTEVETETERKLAMIWSQLLDVRLIGRDHHFFRLGGHSLSAITLSSLIGKNFNADVPVPAIFEHPTLRMMARYIETLDAADTLYPPIPLVENRDYYPVSPAQRRMFLLNRIEGGGINYNIPIVLELDGCFDPLRVEAVIQLMAARHESLRTSFHLVKGEPVQRIHSRLNVPVKEIAGNYDAIAKQCIYPFDLSQAPLFRVFLVKEHKNADRQWAVFDMHHIISDGVSTGNFLNEFRMLYKMESQNVRADLPDIKVNYRDYSVWRLNTGSIGNDKREAFWLERFNDAIPVLSLPEDFPRSSVRSYDGMSESVTLPDQEVRVLRALAYNRDTTVYILLLAAFFVLLAKESGQEDIVIGTPASGRRHPDLEKLIGMFVNTLALRQYPEKEKGFDTFLREMHESAMAAFENQDYPFEELVDKIGVRRDTSRNPLFDVLFSYNHFDGLSDIEREDDFPGWGVLPPPVCCAKFDLTFLVDEGAGNRMDLTLIYCTALYEKETACRIMGHYRKIISQILENPEKMIGQIEIITEAEKHRVLEEFNGQKKQYEKEKTIPGMFLAQVERTPHLTALADDGRMTLTYAYLNNEASRVTNFLARQGIGRGDVVAIMATRSWEMIVGILGILKTGAAYLPMDPDAPVDRIIYMLADSGTGMMLTYPPVSETLMRETDSRGIRLADISGIGAEIVTHGVENRIPDPVDTAYIIYTSGSTGKPKGVAVTHGNFSPLIHWGFDLLGLMPGDRVVQNLSYFFDWSVWEIFLTLLSGSSLYMISREYQVNPSKLSAFIRRQSITVLHLTPTQLTYLLDTGKRLDTIRHLCIGAEKLTLELVDRSFGMVPATCRVYNMYGPTEATIIAAVREIRRSDREYFKTLSSIPIGKPAGNSALFILDPHYHICPVGVPGELYISGDGVTNGYLNRPEPSADAFLNKRFRESRTPFPKGVLAAGGNLYKTGDLCRRLANGEIEFLGRVDFQVKVRGYRIELGEIEHRIRGIDGIRETVAVTGEQVLVEGVPKKMDEAFICAYYVSDDAISPTRLREQLEQSMPGYMVPSYFVHMGCLPLSPTGKVNRRALPLPGETVKREAEYIAPADEIEETLLGIWREVLGKERISVHENLFDLGGNSVLLVKLQSLIEQVYPGKVNVVDMFSYKTISRLATFIRGEELPIAEATIEERDWNIKPIPGAMAITGLAFRVKDTSDGETFWQWLAEGRDCVGPLPDERRKDVEALLAIDGTDLNNVRFQESAYLERIDRFDYRFFRLSPNEASLMDPNQRLFLQTAWSALEDAGYGGDRLRGSRTGVFMGYGGEDDRYRHLVAKYAPGEQGLAMAGNVSSIMASRISYILDFKGPAMVIDTACSSGLTALHTACRSIREGECDQALVGAAKTKLMPLELAFDLEIMSSDGRTRTFDQSSDGTGSGEGVFAFLIKPLNKALEDGDHIHAVVKGSAVNQDGNSIGITAPDADAQADVITAAWKNAGIDPLTVSYIEAHGTGTKLGDPIEIRGITKAFRRFSNEKKICAVGSVKANIGHLDGAAGLAGVLKAVLALKYKQFPPLAHFKSPNRDIDFENGPAYVPDGLTDWPASGGPRRCGVSAFGLSGTNCHVVLEEFTGSDREGMALEGPFLLALSAKSADGLTALASQYRGFLKTNREAALGDICYTANTGRGHYDYRLALTAANREELMERLDGWLAKKTNLNGVFTGHFRMVPANKKDRESNELTDGDLKRLETEALEMVKTLTHGLDGENLAALASLYISGARVNWELFYEAIYNIGGNGIKPLKKNLPTYVFDERRAWLKPAKKPKVSAAATLSLMPLLDRLAVETPGQDVYMTEFNPGRQWLLDEHRVQGIPTLVGTAYLELAQEVWSLYYKTGLEIRDLTIISPLGVEDGSKLQVRTIASRNGSDIKLEVVSKEDENASGSNWVRHAGGVLNRLEHTGGVKMELAELERLCPEIDSPRDFADDSYNGGVIDVSRRWYNLKTIRRGDNCRLGYLELSPEYVADLEEYALHPPLMDAALNFALATIETEEAYLPLMYRRARIYDKLPVAIYSFTKFQSEWASGAETIALDVTLLRPDGSVVAEFEDYTLKKLHMPAREKSLDGFFHDIEWVEKRFEHTDTSKNERARQVSIFYTEGGNANGLAEAFKTMGHDVSMFQWGKQQDFADAIRSIRGQASFNSIRGQASFKDGGNVVFVCPEPRDTHGDESGDDNGDNNVMALFRLVKAVIHENLSSIHLTVVTRLGVQVTGTERCISPDNAAVSGLVRAVEVENPHIACRVIDTDNRTDAGILAVEILGTGGNQLGTGGNQSANLYTAYRDNKRYEPELVELTEGNEDWETRGKEQIRENGVYVITGGLGGIGLEVAKGLAETKKVKLALLGRSALPPRDRWNDRLVNEPESKQAQAIRGIRAIENAGSEVRLYAADTADREQMARVVEDIRASLGRINGIIHSAGVAGQGFLALKDEKTLKNVLRPKTVGTRVLDTVTAQDNPDFTVLCSSLAVLTGSPGQADYTAANGFLDGFAYERSLRGLHTVSINWPGWRDVGMAKDHGVNRDTITFAVDNAEGVRAFFQALGSGRTQVMAGRLNPGFELFDEIRWWVDFSTGVKERLENEKKTVKLSLKTSQQTPHTKTQIKNESVLNPENEGSKLPGCAESAIHLSGRSNEDYTLREKRVAASWAGVLGFEGVDIYENYYDLGGDSINALTIVNGINETMGTDISVVDIFSRLTIHDLALFMDEKYGEMTDGTTAAERTERKADSIERVKVQAYYPLSAAQQRLFILDRFDNSSTGYNLPDVRLIDGTPDIGKLQSAFDKLMIRHETLRTSFKMAGDEPVQVIHDMESVRLTISPKELTNRESDETEAMRAEVQRFVRPFDLSRAPLLRVELLKLDENRYILMTDLHHIIADAFGCDVFMRELASLYAGMELREPAIQYKDFAVWQNNLLDSGVMESQKTYWLKQFEDGVPVMDLPADYRRPQIQSFKGDTAGFILDEETTASLKAFARSNGTTVYTVLLAVYFSLLHRYSGQEDMVIGSATAGRSKAELETLVGMFVNIIPIRAFPGAGKLFRSFLEEVKNTAHRGFENQDYPFDRLVEDLDLERDFSRNPLADVEFSYMSFDNTSLGADLTMGDLRLRPYEGTLKDSSKADIILFCVETETLRFTFEYCSDLFKKERMERMAGHFSHFIGAVMAEPGVLLGRVDFMNAQEKHRLATELNETDLDVPVTDSVMNLIQDRAAENGEATALVWHEDERKSVTYGQLMEGVSVITEALKGRYVEPGDIAAILMDASVEMITAILGVLNAGAAYLPIDPAYPEERISYILRDSNTRVMFLSEETKTGFTDTRDVTAIKISMERCASVSDIWLADFTDGSPVANDSAPVEPCRDNAAYVIYTSGSTGRPKGVAVGHGSLINLCHWHWNAFDISSDDRGGKYAGVGFDASVWEIFPYLTIGASVCIIPGDIKLDMERLHRFVEAEKITVLFLPTQVCEEFMHHGENTGLRVLLAGGDRLRSFTQRSFRIFNNYGPTENTVVSTYMEITEHHECIPIGKPVSNCRVFVLDRQGNLQPEGVPGELILSGANLAQGYLNRPETTNEKFPTLKKSFGESRTPFTKGVLAAGGIIYKSGDLVRWNFDGQLEFLGRIDEQVKVRGYRIELGEIEQVILEFDGIIEVVVLVNERSDGERFLCGFYRVSDGDIDRDELREFIGRRLPDYMVPVELVRVETFPLTANGKVNKRALLESARPEVAEELRVEPGTEIERRLMEIWKSVLGRGGVGVHDNFFDSGGNSLMMIKLNRRLKQVFNRDIQVVTLFRFPTVHRLARYLSEEEGLVSAVEASSQAVEQSKTGDNGTGSGVSGEMAVIGMAGRFPGADNTDEFWENLRDGVESVTFFSDEELLARGVSQELLADRNYIKAGAVVNGMDMFDAAFFGYSRLEAQLMDPQMRIFHECAVEALENAGYDHRRYNGLIGLYAGASSSYSWQSRVHRSGLAEGIGIFAAINLVERDFLCSRVSYNLNLNGPSFNIQTACSTSLVAIHEACGGLAANDCDIALAGGVSALEIVRLGYRYEEGMIQSSDGHCKAFDNASDGTVFGSGAGVAVLKRLEHALRDNDHIYAVVKGSAINNDGNRKVGYAAPSIEGQTDVIRRAHRAAGIEPGSVTYIETHGTGTKLGDPVEVEALKLAFGNGEKNSCALGSVKTNIGHLDAAAGVAGFIKTVLSVYHGRIPATLHFREANREIDFENSRFYVNTSLMEWKRDRGPLLAGVSSFGIGGTNAHAVIEEAPMRKEMAVPENGEFLLLLSGRTAGTLEKISSNLGEFFDANEEVNPVDAAYTLAVGRSRASYRRAAVCDSIAGASTILCGQKINGAWREDNDGATLEQPGIVFMFPGQGAQYVDMGRELYRGQPVFGEAMDNCFDILERLTDINLKEILYPGSTGTPSPTPNSAMIEGEPAINRTEITQPLLFVLEYSLAKMLMAWGIMPTAMMGHSIGEYVAAHLSGVMDLEGALKLVTARGRLMQSLPGGSMLSVPLDERELKGLLKYETDIDLAAVNTTGRCVVSGPDEAIERFGTVLDGLGHEWRKLHTSHAFHSAMMDPVLEDFKTVVREIKLSPPRVPYISNLTGKWMTAEQAVSADYWADHLRNGVMFSPGLERLLENGDRAFIEVGPGNALSTFTRRHKGCTKKQSRHVVNLLRHPKETTGDGFYLLQQVGKLWLSGVQLDWDAFYRHKKAGRVPLPTYPFERTLFTLPGGHSPAVMGSASASSSGMEPRAAEPVVETANTVDEGLEENYANETERILAGIWGRFFGLERVDVTDDFFQLGGDSLMAVRMISQINERFSVRLPAHTLLQTTTIRELTALIGGNEEKREFLAIIREGDPGMRPVFLVHPIGGSVYFYRDLADSIGSERPVYGLQARGLDDEAEPLTSIGEMAQRYLSEIRKIQPEGPYILGGSSFGGIVVFEMARRLKEENEEASFLFMIDTPGPGHMPERFEDDAEILSYYLNSVREGEPYTPQQVRSLDKEALRDLLRANGNRGDLAGNETATIDVERLLKVFKANYEAMFAYRPQPFDGELLFFLASEETPYNAKTPDRAWLDLASVEVFQVPGDHITMNLKPNVEHIARVLNGKLTG